MDCPGIDFIAMDKVCGRGETSYSPAISYCRDYRAEIAQVKRFRLAIDRPSQQSPSHPPPFGAAVSHLRAWREGAVARWFGKTLDADSREILGKAGGITAPLRLREWSLWEAVKRRYLWRLFRIHILTGLGSLFVSPHQLDLAADVGFDRLHAAGV
jgi:hypothetical protein